MVQADVQTDLVAMGQRGLAAARRLATVSTEQKNAALHAIAAGLRQDMPAILRANAEDVGRAERAGIPPAMIARLLLNPQSVEGIAAEVEHVAALPDPVGERFDDATLPNGLRLHKRRTPLGVIGVIYESRPNV